MRNWWLKEGLAGIVGLTLLSSEAGATKIGSVNHKDYSGAIGILSSGVQEELQYGVAIYSYETVVTNATASTVLLFHDSSALQVGSNSRVVLDKFIYDPAPDAGQAVLKLGRGAFRLITGSTKHEDNLTIRTPTLSMVVRGTHLLIFVLGDGTTEVNVIEGEVGARPCKPQPDIPLTASQAMTVDPRCNAVLGVAREPGSRTEPPSMPSELAARDLEPAAGPAESSLPPEDTESGGSVRGGKGDAGGQGGSASSAGPAGPAGPSGPAGPQGNNQHHGHR